jgi:3-phenylpropionate/trans-cinnamate dioxygenase ferredoxin component
MTFIEIARVSDLPVGRAKACPVAGHTVALYHTQSGFFATTNTCPHRGGPLGEGDLLGNEIVCPWHFWSFDVTTGVNCANAALAIPTYEVRIEGDRILVRES